MISLGTTAAKRAETVARTIDRCSHLAMMPDIAVKVMALADKSEATPREMAELIAHSPVLAVRILRVVNSAFYGLPGEVSTIDRAVSVMGLQSVKNVAVAASVMKVFHGPALTPKFAPRDLWLHSVTVGGAARLIARKARLESAEEAFLAGLIHDVGHVVQMHTSRVAVVSMLKEPAQGSASDFLAREERCFEATHQDFGLALTQRWNLPRALTVSTAMHHNPGEAIATGRMLAMVVHVADRLAMRYHPGYALDAAGADFAAGALDQLRLTRADVEAIAAQVPGIADEAVRYLAS